MTQERSYYAKSLAATQSCQAKGSGVAMLKSHFKHIGKCDTSRF